MAATKTLSKLARSKNATKKNTGGGNSPFGVSSPVDFELSDVHHQTSEDIMRALMGPAMLPVKVKKVKVKKSKHHDRAAKKAEEEVLKQQIRDERRRAKKLGVMNLVRVPKELHKQFARNVSAKQKELLNFILTTIAPIDVSLDPAAADATEAIKVMTGSQDVAISMTRAHAMLKDLIDLKMLEFMSDQLEISSSMRKVVIAKHFQATSSSKSKSTDLLRKLLSEKMNAESKIQNVAPVKDRKTSVVVKPRRIK